MITQEILDKLETKIMEEVEQMTDEKTSIPEENIAKLAILLKVYETFNR